MKFKDLFNGHDYPIFHKPKKDNVDYQVAGKKMFLLYTEATIQSTSKSLIGRNLKLKELTVLERKIHTEIANLIIKIESSGAGK